MFSIFPLLSTLYLNLGCGSLTFSVSRGFETGLAAPKVQQVFEILIESGFLKSKRVCSTGS